MNIIESKFDIIQQKYNDLLPDMFKHIELCGRNCYKSEDKITDESYKKFVEMLENSNHGAMLEHGTVYLTIGLGTPIDDPQYMWKMDIVRFFQSNKFSIVKEETVNEIVDVEIKGFGMRTQASAHFYYITTNWRVVYENREKILIKYMNNRYHITTEKAKDSILSFICQPTDKHELRHTVAFIYHLAAARDVNRHRVQSVAEESTRYCDYTKEKFAEGESAGLNIIKPERLSQDTVQEKYDQWNVDNNIFFDMCNDVAHGGTKDWTDIDWWLFSNVVSQESYFQLKNQFKWTNQECSLILPLDTKTCSIHTAFDSDWVHFFNLRALGSTGAPRPSIKKLAIHLMELFIENGWVKPEQLDQKYYQIYLEKKNENN